MEKREEIIKVLDAIIPNEVSNLYIELIKLIDLYNLKYYYLNIKNKELSKLISTINIDELKENKRLLINTEIEKDIQKRITFTNGDFGSLNLLINKTDRLRKKISIEEQKIQNWYSNEIEIDELLMEISKIVRMIESKLNDIFSLDLVAGERRIDNLKVVNRHMEMLNNIDGLSVVESSTLFFVINNHLEMWKNSFKVTEDIAIRIIDSYKRRELINVEDFKFLIIYSSILLCDANSNYEELLNSIFNHLSEEEFTASNDQNTIIVREISDYLINDCVSNEFDEEFKYMSYLDRHYVWMYSLMMKNYKMKNNFVKQKVKK